MKKNLKVLFVATTARSHINTFHLAHIKKFQQNNWLVHVATNGDAKVDIADKEFSLSIARNPLYLGNIFAIFKLKKIIQKEKYDLITCHTPMGGVVARLAAFFAKASPVVYMAHGFHFYKGAPIINIFYKFIEKKLAKITDAIITMNQEDFNAAKKFCLRNKPKKNPEKNRVYKNKIYKISGIGVDIKKFSHDNFDNNNKKNKRAELNILENSFVILNIAEMIKRKNQATLIKAFSKINFYNAFLLICGRGKLEKKLKNLTKKLNISHKVKFLGFRNDIPDILKISDIFVFPSFQEGLPLAVIEAMSVGLPIVCSDIRGNRDLIKNNQNGFLVNTCDINKYTEKINLLINNKKIRDDFRKKNLELVKKYDISNVINQLEKVYKEVLS